MAQIPKGRLEKGQYEPILETVPCTFQLLHKDPY